MLRNACLVGLALTVSGCAVDGGDAESLVDPQTRIGVADDDADSPPARVALDTTKREPPCPFELSAQPPLPEQTAPDPDAPCFSHAKRDLRAAKKAMRSRYHRRFDDSRLQIDASCDQLDDTIEQLVMETSSGHGFSLNLDRLTRRDDGDYDLLRLSFDARVDREPGYCVTTRLHDRDVEPQPQAVDAQWLALGNEGGQVFRAVLPGDAIEPMIRSMRARLALEPTEIEPPPRDDEIRLGGYWGSSRDFHVAYRMTDSGDRSVGAEWAGYEGAGDQAVWLPLDLAWDAYGAVMWEDSIDALLQPAEVDADARDFFVDRFRAAQSRNDEFGIWYVRERLLGMAQDLADPRLFADLLQAAALPGKHSEQRSREAAAQALSQLSGWTPTEDGVTLMSPNDAAAHLLTACG